MTSTCRSSASTRTSPTTRTWGPLLGLNVKRIKEGETEPNGVGSVRQLSAKGLMPFEETVTEAIPNERIEYRVTKGTPLKNHLGVMVFSSTGEGRSHLDYTITFDAAVPGLDKLIAQGVGPQPSPRAASPRLHRALSGSAVQRMQIYGVSFDMVGKQPIVLLKTTDGNRFLPIWIGHPEAAAILMKLQGASTPRPMTHDLLIEMLEQLDAKCERVSVTELRDNTFYASITISVNGSEIEIDSRPSDAIALAVRCQAPIFAAEDVIEESSIEFEHEVEDTDEVVEKFKNFLDEVTPEDFAAEDQ